MFVAVIPEIISMSLTVAPLTKISLLSDFISYNPPKLISECLGTITKLDTYGETLVTTYVTNSVKKKVSPNSQLSKEKNSLIADIT
jgi:hypothetical protein